MKTFMFCLLAVTGLLISFCSQGDEVLERNDTKVIGSRGVCCFY